MKVRGAARWGALALSVITTGCALATGCAQLLGLGDDPGATVDAAVVVDAAPPPDATVDAAPPSDASFACAEDTFEPALGERPVDTSAARDDVTPSCATATGGETTLRWTAPVTDYYVFSTAGATFDTVLSLRDGCGGTELQCDDNGAGGLIAELVRKVAASTELLVSVDGNGDRGTATLAIHRVSCPDADLEGATLPLRIDTTGRGDDVAATCGGDGHPDRAFHWTAPADGLYRIKATAPSHRPVLAVFDGPRCVDAELGCGRGGTGGIGGEVVRRFTTDRPVSIVVDGADGAGSVDLAIEPITRTCPTAIIANGDFVEGTFGARLLAPSCAAAVLPGPFGEDIELGDQSFGFVAPGHGNDCFGRCTITATSDRPLVLYALAGDDCSGPELGCVYGQLQKGQEQPTATLELRMGDEPTPYTIVVAQADDQGARGFTLSAVCNEACP